MKRIVYNLSMFIVAPLIGGLYALLFPIVATTLLWIMGVDALIKTLEDKGLARNYYKELHNL